MSLIKNAGALDFPQYDLSVIELSTLSMFLWCKISFYHPLTIFVRLLKLHGSTKNAFHSMYCKLQDTKEGSFFIWLFYGDGSFLGFLPKTTMVSLSSLISVESRFV